MSIEDSVSGLGTEYEIAYNEDLRAKAEKELHKIMETNPVRQTGNTGPADTVDKAEKRPDSVEEYLTFLELTYPGSIFSIGDFTGDMSGLTGMGSIMLSDRLLQRMVGDPVFAVEMEDSIRKISMAQDEFLAFSNLNDATVYSYGSVIDENGKVKNWNFSLSPANFEEQAESTGAFMQMEGLREKAMKLETEREEFLTKD